MKQKNRKWLWLIPAALLVCLILFLSNPLLAAKTFVALNRDRVEANLAAGLDIADGVFGKSPDLWEGEHTMAEFTLLVWGDTYYGCYYSADDVPLPFQNADADLTQTEPDTWIWTGVGDNSGKTSKIADRWYYFEASF